jgi:hypothetical protein
MSSPLAIAAVSAVLKDLLDNAVVDDSLIAASGVVKVTLLAPNRINTDTTESSQLNLYLYQVTQNASWRNVGLPSRNDRGDRLTNPPLALNLHYLLTAYGSADFAAEILLGYAMQLLHETPVLTRDAIRTALTPSPVTGNLLPPPMDKFLASDLADQIEQIKITPDFLTTEEMSKLWTAMQVGYHISMAYQASVVLIQGQRPTNIPLPVRERKIHVLPFSQPVIDEVLVDNKPAQMVETGDTLTLHGRNFNVGSIQVKFGATAVAPATNNGKTITVIVPATLQIGVNTVQVVQLIDFNTAPPPDLRRSFASNLSAFMLVPMIVNQPAAPEPVFGTVPRNGPFTVQVSPPVGRVQDVQLLLGSNTLKRDTPAPSDPPTTTSLNFSIPSDFPTGEFLVRVLVDGAQSKLVLDPTKPPGDPTASYVGPKVLMICNSNCLRCNFAAFSSTATGVECKIAVKEETAAVMPDAEISATWTLPDGTTLADTQKTVASGEAIFSVIGGNGTYILTINDITNKDFALDQQHSTLTQSLV